MSLRIVILTVSDRSARGERPDESGPALAALIESQGWQVVRKEIVADDQATIEQVLRACCDGQQVDVVLTSGGTGFAQRDVTPEATLAVIERSAPGLAEAMRSVSLQATAHAMLSRATAGIRKKTLIVNLPGSPKGALENLNVILPVLPHAVQLLQDDPRSEAGHRTV